MKNVIDKLFLMKSFHLIIPEGANVYIFDHNNEFLGRTQTPATLELKSASGLFRGAKYTLLVEHEGFERQTHLVTSRVSGLYPLYFVLPPYSFVFGFAVPLFTLNTESVRFDMTHAGNTTHRNKH